MRGDAVEVEVKLSVADPEAARSRIESAGFSIHKARVFERNIIFDTSDRTLRQRGELLRVRRVNGRGLVTFKGPQQQARHKTREELQSEVSDPAMLERLFLRIGFVPAFRYDKYRTEFRRISEDGVVTLDETPIGSFLELEGPPAWIDKVARELGFEESEYILSSYATLYFDYCARQKRNPGDMVFTGVE